ncbi:MAG: RNA polymerase sigma factor [Chloroflexota bacterium]
MAANDVELMALIARGDEQAFASLYDSYADRLYRYALVRCRRSDIAEEAVQEALLAAWRGAVGFRGDSSLATWLFGICHHCLSHLLRKLAPESALPVGDEADGEVQPASDPWPAQDERLTLAEALARLDEGQRTAVFLVYYQGLRLDEAARVIGVPEGTVKSRLHTARRNLASELDSGEGSSDAAV